LKIYTFYKSVCRLNPNDEGAAHRGNIGNYLPINTE